MKIHIGIQNEQHTTTIMLNSTTDLLREDIQELRECLANIFRCNEKEITFNIIEL